MQNRSERGFAQAPHPSSRSLKEERTTTSDQHGERRTESVQAYDDPECIDRHGSSARLAHYGVDSGTAGLSHGSVRDAIAFAINMRTPVRTIDATFVTSIAMTAAAYGCRSAAAFG